MPAVPRRDKSPGGSTSYKEAPNDSAGRRNQHRRRRIRRLHGFQACRRRQRQLPGRWPHAAAGVGGRCTDGLRGRHQRHAGQHRPGVGVRLLGRGMSAARSRAVSVLDWPVLRQTDEPDGPDVVPRLLPPSVRQAGRDRRLGDADHRVLHSGGRKSGRRRASCSTTSSASRTGWARSSSRSSRSRTPEPVACWPTRTPRSFRWR